MKQPVRIISDLHLGHRVSRIEKVSSLRPLLAGAGTVVFNGDSWQELSKSLRAMSALMLEELHELCRQEGCETIFLPGNHDPGWGGDGFLELAEGKIIVTHGDSLLRSGAPWKREVLLAPEQVEALWQASPGADTDPVQRHELARQISRALPVQKPPRGRHLFQRAWDAVHPPQRGIEMLKAWWTQAALGRRFCDRYFPMAEILIIGHFHKAGTWQIGNLRVMNTGSFVSPGRAYWVEICDRFITFGQVEESEDRFSKGNVLGVWQLGN